MSESIAKKRRQHFDVPGDLNVGGTLTGVDYFMVNAIGSDGSVDKLLQGTESNRPANGNAGVWYFATDTQKLYRDTGSAWEMILTLNHQEMNGSGNYNHTEIDTHIDSVSNPHSVTAKQVPIEDTGANFDATDLENALLEEYTERVAHMNDTNNPHVVTTEQINALNLSGGTMTGQIVLPRDPSISMEAATKQYVDSMQQGLDVKESVRVATSSTEHNIDIDKAPLQIDGVTLSVGNRVLVKDNAFSSNSGEVDADANATRNGIYKVDSLLDLDSDGTDDAVKLVRTLDADQDDEVTAGLFTFVAEGTEYGNMGFVMVSDDPVTIGTHDVNFSQFSGAGQVIAGDGMYKDGNELGVTDSGITDAKIGQRTVSDDFVPAADTENLTNTLNAIVNRIKTLAGTTDWKTDPTTSINAIDEAPEAPANLTLSEVGSTVNVQFDLPSVRENISEYEIWRSVGDETDYNLVDTVRDGEIAGAETTYTFVDDSYEANTTIYYKVMSNHSGVRSATITDFITPVNTIADPTNLKVIADIHNYKVEYDVPEDRRLDSVIVKVDQASDTVSLDYANATQVYQGTSDNFTYEIPESDKDLYHKFWVESVTRS